MDSKLKERPKTNTMFAHVMEAKYTFIHMYFKDPEFLAIHPNTLDDLINNETRIAEFGKEPLKGVKITRFAGMRVLRTEDIELTEIKVF